MATKYKILGTAVEAVRPEEGNIAYQNEIVEEAEIEPFLERYLKLKVVEKASKEDIEADEAAKDAADDAGVDERTQKSTGDPKAAGIKQQPAKK